ncbi:MAG: HAMP domain-containing histidine kinase, partial [Armatimonadetes bacterium]|nr:HAMP domain-containing histidine kinase [Armatimonadota bacterium]
ALEFASCDDLAGPAHEYRAHLQKSPVRDLAFLSDDVPRVTYPLPPDGQQRRSWFWLTKLCHFAAADGLRLRTPDRRAWTLFAFYDDEEQAREARAKGLFGTLALSLEDALWHPHYERHANATRGVLERGERVRELGHELKHALKDVDAVVGTHVESLQSSSLGQVNPTGALEDTRARLEKLHHLTERFLGRPEGRSEAVPLQPLLRRCWLPYSPPDSPWCRAPYIRVHVPVVEPASLMVKGDPDLIEAVVDNLVRNAVDAVEKTRALRVGAADGLTGEISIEAIVDDASAERACIYVHDTGLGISRYVGAHMVRRDFSTTGGTGLGMSIGYSSAAATKGLLNIEETGMYVGTTFALRLPIAQ